MARAFGRDWHADGLHHAFTVRIPPALMEQVEYHRGRMAKGTMRGRRSQSEAVMDLLALGLLSLQPAEDETPKPAEGEPGT